MRRLRALWMRLMRAGRDRLDFESELESHLQMHIDDGIRSGLSEPEARRQALIWLGGAEQTRQSYRERAGLLFLETLLQDARFALCRCLGFRRSWAGTFWPRRIVPTGRRW